VQEIQSKGRGLPRTAQVHKPDLHL